MKYKKILVKFSGESFGPKGKPVELKRVQKIVDEVKELRKTKVKVAIVSGGGNVVRGITVSKEDRLQTDYKGMKATFKNIEALSGVLKKGKINYQIFTSYSIKNKKYPIFNYQKAKKTWQQNKVIIIGGGTGYPFLSTDTAAVLRSLELEADLLIKATKVDGVYSADPLKDKNAKRYPKLSYRRFVEEKLKVMDLMAVALAWSNSLPIRVIKWEPGNVVKVARGGKLGTLIY